MRNSDPIPGGVLIGYKNDYSSYKICCLDDLQIRIVKHLHFDETTFPTCPASNKSLNRNSSDKLPDFSGQEHLPFKSEEELPEEGKQPNSIGSEEDEDVEMELINESLKGVRELSVPAEATHNRSIEAGNGDASRSPISSCVGVS
ncbi:hypothetical protein PSTG_19838 [Puccinia striiformis f. sp. tritici PST-78]|uniref:Uncharacterized protein n=1 Tax=Puccinia striiformis f. sp. tritici PST-78 TaxID=1165861 RepID=A0A0L0UIM2_9BASI|nr:hypothetical protein PSTG_19838 [Puccinia striiformis f. sp. tritici PST-78]